VHSKKQAYVALSTIEAEYIPVGNSCAHILWMKQQLEDYNIYINHIPLKCDNMSAINLTKNDRGLSLDSIQEELEDETL